jgi:multicomponent Na+:H+ antiporter subunit C
MSTATLFGFCAAALIGLGLYGLIVQPHPLRKLLSINVIGSGVFVLFGVMAERATLPGPGPDPVPQALVITGIVVAFSATALAVALLLRLAEASGSASLTPESSAVAEDDGRED